MNPRQQDTQPKSLLGHSGTFSSREAVEIVVDHPATPRFLTTKLVRYFVVDEPAPPAELIEPLAREFQERGLDVGWLVERIVSSQLFFSDLVIGRKMRSPVELGIGTLRALEGTSNLYELAQRLDDLGQCVFYPPSVKGWDGGRTWINSATLLGRTNLVAHLVEHKQSRFGESDLETLAARHGRRTPEELVDWIAELLIAVPLGNSVRERLLAVAREKAENRSRQIGRVLLAASALPEFQLS